MCCVVIKISKILFGLFLCITLCLAGLERPKHCKSQIVIEKLKPLAEVSEMKGNVMPTKTLKCFFPIFAQDFWSVTVGVFSDAKYL